MTTTILETSLVLLQMVCVIIVIAYLVTRSRFFSEVLGGHPRAKTQAIFAVIFGGVSIYGTISGVEVLGAIVNVRDLGPMVAGLTCGPVVGLIAGLIGAVHRMSLGGFTAPSCSIATVLAGLLGGLICLGGKRRFVGIKIAVLFAASMEVLHMLLALLIDRPFSAALEVVSSAVVPMVLANSTGMFIFAFVITNLETERRTQQERDSLLREMERKDTELKIAAEIQRSFLPETIEQVPGFDIAARSIMAKEVGGDFFDVVPFEVIPLNKRSTGVVIADVSGKGVPAALFMALSRIVIRVNALWHEKPADAIRDANNTIAHDSQSGMFVTAFYGKIDWQTRTLTYVNAGHNPPLLLRARNREFSQLSPTGIAIGAMENSEYTASELSLESDDVIVLYTDGVTEAVNPHDEMFGEERLRNVVKACTNSSAHDLIERILEEVKSFCGDWPQSDDITLMVIKVCNADPETLELNVKAVIENLPHLMDNIQSFMRDRGFTDETVLDVQLAVDEAVTNIIRHGYRGRDGVIEVRCRVSAQDVVITIEDSAEPFDPLSVKEPELGDDVESRQIGGLGIFLMRKKMDQVTYEFKNGKNVLTLRKKTVSAR
jgi:sigma-B regulation protein RsbU (phosphoserine phosphatase)